MEIPSSIETYIRKLSGQLGCYLGLDVSGCDREDYEARLRLHALEVLRKVRPEIAGEALEKYLGKALYYRSMDFFRERRRFPAAKDLVPVTDFIVGYYDSVARLDARKALKILHENLSPVDWRRLWAVAQGATAQEAARGRLRRFSLQTQRAKIRESRRKAKKILDAFRW
jgi:hypothetical protein